MHDEDEYETEIKGFHPEITAKAMTKLDLITKNAEREVGGLMKVETKNGQPRVTDIILLKQTATHGDFKIEEEALMEFFTKACRKGLKETQKYCGWVHKHPMTGWSGQDNDTFKRLLKDWDGFVLGIVKQPNNKYLWRLDMARMDQKKNILNYIKLETEDFQVVYDDSRMEKDIIKQMKELVKEPNPMEGIEITFKIPKEKDGPLFDKEDKEAFNGIECPHCGNKETCKIMGSCEEDMINYCETCESEYTDEEAEKIKAERKKQDKGLFDGFFEILG